MSIFTKERVKSPRRSKKNMSFLNILTTRFGALTPILCKEVYPNETWKETPSVLCRMTPLIAPLMSKMEIRVDYFFVPNRILWTDWEEFITRGLDGMSELTLPMAQLRDLSPLHGSLADYLNLPTLDYNGGDYRDELLKDKWSEEVQVLPFYAYSKIYQDWYADENLQPNEVEFFDFPLSTEDMLLPANLAWVNNLKSRGWKKDYFTACLPWAQRGPEVSMRTSIVGNGGTIGEVDTTIAGSGNMIFKQTEPGTPGIIDSETEISIDGTTVIPLGSNQQQLKYRAGLVLQGGEVSSTEGVLEGLEGEGFTINEFRRLYRLQLWFERNARAGGRYIESILAHFGKRVPDYRLDRSEYIGGVTNEFTFGEVLQTSSNDSETGQALGAYAGRGISLLNGKIKKYRVDEHGWLLGILSIRPKRNAYYQGIPREFSRKTALDMMWPLFTNLGEQEVKNKEIYLSDDEDVRDGVFGYNPRYSELYQSLDQIHGEMRNSLDFWHTARKFNQQPTLSFALVDVMNGSLANLNRIFAYDETEQGTGTFTSENDHFILEVHQNITAKRCLPVYPIPSL